MVNVKLLLEWVTIPLFILALQLPQGAVLYWLASSLTALAQVRCVPFLPLFPVIVFCHCSLSLFPVIVPCHRFSVIVPCHCSLSSFSVIVPCHCSLSLIFVIVPCHCSLSSFSVIVPCHCPLSLFPVIVLCHCSLSLFPVNSCHCFLSLFPVIFLSSSFVIVACHVLSPIFAAVYQHYLLLFPVMACATSMCCFCGMHNCIERGVASELP